MARKRMIDPIIWQDENFGRLSPRARLLFIGLFSNADDEGRIRANPAYIKSTIFMYDNLAFSKIIPLIEEVVSTMDNIKYYDIDGNQYIYLSKWEDYQKQHKDRVQKSTLPPYKEDVSDNVGQVTDNVGVVKVKLSKVRLDKINNTKVLQQVAVYGNQDINLLLAYLKEKLKLPLLDESEKVNRRYAYLCTKKFGLEKTKLAIDATAQSRFWHTKVTSFKALYYNAVQIISSNRGEVRSVDATKVLDSKNEGRQGVPAVGGGVPDTETKLTGGAECGVVSKVFN